MISDKNEDRGPAASIPNGLKFLELLEKGDGSPVKWNSETGYYEMSEEAAAAALDYAVKNSCLFRITSVDGVKIVEAIGSTPISRERLKRAVLIVNGRATDAGMAKTETTQDPSCRSGRL